MNNLPSTCLVIAFTLLPFVYLSYGDLCTIETNKCTTTDAWQSNLRCRILGSFNDSGSNQGDGYIIDSTNIQTNDSFYTIKGKMRATVSIQIIFSSPLKVSSRPNAAILRQQHPAP